MEPFDSTFMGRNTLTMTQFRAPNYSTTYIDLVLKRCKSLISTGIWEGLELGRIDAWMQNFDDGAEKYFAARVLDALIYRSTKQTKALMEQLFDRTLEDLSLTNSNLQLSGGSWLEAIRGSSPHELCVIPVIRNDDPPSKSGPLIARMYKRYLGADEELMYWPWLIDRLKTRGTRIFLFVDDFLGTGKQFKEFTIHFQLDNLLEGAEGVYAPLVAHEKGMRYVSKHVPYMHLAPVEILGRSHELFSSDSDSFLDDSNSPEGAREFYYTLLKKYGFDFRGRGRRGFGNLGLAYGFQHATPNNCLPILWKSTDSWTALLQR